MNDWEAVSIRSGATAYVLEPDVSALSAKLTHINSEGETVIVFPVSLLEAYARQWAQEKAREFVGRL